MNEPKREWMFMVDDFDGPQFLDALGNEIDETDAKRDPFVGTDLEAFREGERRTDLWEERTGKWAERITRHSLGIVEGDAEIKDERHEAAGIERCSEVFHAESSIGEQISVPCKTVTITMTTQGPLPPRIQIVDADGFAALVADRKRLTDTLHQVDDLLSADFIVAKDSDYRTALGEWLKRNIEMHDDPAVSETARKREEYRRGLEAVIIAIKEACGMGPDAPNENMAVVIGDALRRKNASIEAMADIITATKFLMSGVVDGIPHDCAAKRCAQMALNSLEGKKT